MNIPEIEKEIHACRACDLSGKINAHPFSQYLNVDRVKEIKYLFLGRNPGLEHAYPTMDFSEYRKLYHENFLKSNFGEYLLKTIGESTLNEYSLFTNTVKCPTAANIEPAIHNYKSCMLSHLFRQIDLFKPKKIFIFGKSVFRAMAFVFGDLSFPMITNSWRTHFTKVTVINKDGSPYQEMIVLYHPSYFLRGGSTNIAERQAQILMEECK